MPNSEAQEPGTTRVLAILQARMSSKRLPGKVLHIIQGKPMLALQLERLRRCRLPAKLIVATSTDASDAPIAALCERERVECFRGSLEDVLDRFHNAALPHRPDHVVRLTADCPLADPELIDRVIQYHVEGGFDFTSNAIVRTFPAGLDAGVFRHALLVEAWREAKLPAEREHVTLYMRKNAARYKIGVFKDAQDRSYHRWTVDEQADIDLVRAIYDRLYPQNVNFGTEDILRLLEREPSLAEINRDVKQNVIT